MSRTENQQEWFIQVASPLASHGQLKGYRQTEDGRDALLSPSFTLILPLSFPFVFCPAFFSVNQPEWHSIVYSLLCWCAVKNLYSSHSLIHSLARIIPRRCHWPFDAKQTNCRSVSARKCLAL